MAIAHVARDASVASPNSAGTTSPTSPLTLQLTPAIGDTLVVCVSFRETGASVNAGGVTDDQGNTYVLQVVQSTNTRDEIWTCLSATTANLTTVSVAFSGAPTRMCLAILTYTGVVSIGNNGANSGAATTTPNVAVTTQDANNWVVAAGSSATSGAWTTNGVNTVRQSVVSGSANRNTIGAGDSGAVASPAATTVTFTQSSNAYGMVGVELRSVSGATQSSAPLLTTRPRSGAQRVVRLAFVEPYDQRGLVGDPSASPIPPAPRPTTGPWRTVKPAFVVAYDQTGRVGDPTVAPLLVAKTVQNAKIALRPSHVAGWQSAAAVTLLAATGAAYATGADVSQAVRGLLAAGVAYAEARGLGQATRGLLAAGLAFATARELGQATRGLSAAGSASAAASDLAQAVRGLRAAGAAAAIDRCLAQAVRGLRAQGEAYALDAALLSTFHGQIQALLARGTAAASGAAAWTGIGHDLSAVGLAVAADLGLLFIKPPVFTRGTVSVRSGDARMPGIAVPDPRW